MDNYSLKYVPKQVHTAEKHQLKQQRQFVDNRTEFVIKQNLKEGIQKNSIQYFPGKVIQGWWPHSWIMWLSNYLRNRGQETPENMLGEPKESVDNSKDTEEKVSTEKDQQTQKKRGEQLREKLHGSIGDCLYQAVAYVTGEVWGTALELRYLAADWVLNNPGHDVFGGLDVNLDDVVLTICTPGQWTGPAGDRAPFVLANALNIRLEIITNNGTRVINETGNGNYRIYYYGNHYTAQPIVGIHVPKPETSTPPPPVETEAIKPVELTLADTSLPRRLSFERQQKLIFSRRSLGAAIGFNSKDADIIRRIDIILNSGIHDSKELRIIERYVKNRESQQIGNHTLEEEGMGEKILERGDFKITGIVQGAPLNRVPKGADADVIRDFEAAINTRELTWHDFKGTTHNNVYHKRSGKTFKAHQDGKTIKLYIDPSEGAKSKLRAIYKLEGTTLTFDKYESH